MQKPNKILLQKKTYSLHKHANLFKPMMVVTPSGYILAADGLYFADNGNTDAEILKAMLSSSEFNNVCTTRKRCAITRPWLSL